MTKCSKWSQYIWGWKKSCASNLRSAQARIEQRRDQFIVLTRNSDEPRWRSVMTFVPTIREGALRDAKRWADGALRHLTGSLYFPRRKYFPPRNRRV
jgi:hypothetical protein